MPLQISRNDIRNIEVDAIVNSSDRFLSGSGSIDKIIHELAGANLDKALQNKLLDKGQAIITDSFNMGNCKYVIHTNGPVYIDENNDEEDILRLCYKAYLQLAKTK